jgi:phage host-nuclease inhibitor protein Gam
MEAIEFFYIIGGIGLSIISYFLKRTMDELKEIKRIAYDTKEKVAIMEIDYLNKVSNLNEKIDNLQETIKELTMELKNWNETWARKNKL